MKTSLSYWGAAFCCLLLIPLSEMKLVSEYPNSTAERASILPKAQEIGGLNPFDQAIELSEEAHKTLFNSQVQIYKLKRNGNHYGHSVWFKRSGKKVKAKYFASGEVGDRYEDWKSDKKIIMACSGAFTTNDFGSPLPVGLTVDNGKVVNKIINEEMDGLVLVYATGGIAVSDKEMGNLYLASLGKTVDIRDSWDKYELLQWAEEEEATIFQTQLLAYKNELRLEVHKARKKNRERRILVLARNAQKEVFHIVYDVDHGVFLGEIAQGILDYLKSKNTEVVAMLNLDTGWYNMMKLYNLGNDMVLSHHPDKDPTNLLVYYYQE